MNFVTPLNEATRKQLQTIYHDDGSFKRRLRAHAKLVLKSNAVFCTNAVKDSVYVMS